MVRVELKKRRLESDEDDVLRLRLEKWLQVEEEYLRLKIAASDTTGPERAVLSYTR